MRRCCYYRLSHLLLVGAVGFLFTLVSGAFIVPHMIPVPQVEEVPDPRGAVAPEDNGWPLLRAALRDVAGEPFETEYPSKPTAVSADVLALVERNGEALSLLDEALRRRYLELPWDGSDPYWWRRDPHLRTHVRQLARLQCQSAYLAAARHDVTGGIGEALSVIWLGRRIAAGGGPWSTYGTGCTVASLGRECLRAVVSIGSRQVARPLDAKERCKLPKLGRAERLSVEAALRELLPEEELLASAQRAMAWDWLYLRYYLQHPELWDNSVDPACGFRSEIGTRSVFYDGLRTHALAQDQAATTRRLLRLPRWERPADILPTRSRPEPPAPLLNRVGWAQVICVSSGGQPLLDLYDRQVAEERQTAVYLALCLYVDDHGHVPKDLSELAEAGLPAWKMVDPYSGKPMGYQPREGLLCIAGPDGIGGEDYTTAVPFVRSPSQ